jgi:hypothetical protein
MFSFACACALATACAAGQTRDVGTMQRAQYAIDEGTANVLVRDALENYPLVERGQTDRLETRWVRGPDGSAYKLVVHIDGPGGGPFMVRVDTKLRTKTGAILEHDIPGWLRERHDRVVENIYRRLEPTKIVAEPPTAVAGR